MTIYVNTLESQVYSCFLSKCETCSRSYKVCWQSVAASAYTYMFTVHHKLGVQSQTEILALAGRRTMNLCFLLKDTGYRPGISSGQGGDRQGQGHRGRQPSSRETYGMPGSSTVAHTPTISMSSIVPDHEHCNVCIAVNSCGSGTTLLSSKEITTTQAETQKLSLIT